MLLQSFQRHQSTSDMSISIAQFLQTEDEKADRLGVVADQEAVFLEMFGTRLALFPNRNAAQEATARFYKTSEDFIAAKIGHPVEPQNDSAIVLKKYGMNEPIGLFFHSGIGLLFTPAAPLIVGFLEGKDQKGLTAKSVFLMLFGKLPFPLVAHILACYPTAQLQLDEFGFDTMMNVRALCWYLNPEGYEDTHPKTLPIAK